MSKCWRCGKEADANRPHSILCVECNKVSRQQDKGVSQAAKKHKGDRCRNCGFVALHSCQLDVDHIDGNRDNDSPENLQTLCANCHRLKTHLNKDNLRWMESEPVDPPQLTLVL